jgi:hypothetical protein
MGILIDQLPSNFTPGESQNFAFSLSVVYISNPTSLWNICPGVNTVCIPESTGTISPFDANFENSITIPPGSILFTGSPISHLRATSVPIMIKKILIEIVYNSVSYFY